MNSRLSIAVLVLLTLGLLGSLACARVFPPADPAVGPTPTPALQPPVAAHGPPGEEDCRVCHEADSKYTAALKEDHPVPIPPGFKGTAREACQLCHDMGLGHKTAGAVPHPIEGMGDCGACHSTGSQDLPQMPDDHSNRSTEACGACHASGVLEGETTATEGPTTDTDKNGKPSPISHSLEGREKCLTCHGGAIEGISAVPANHGGYDDQMCGLCHKPE